MGNLAPGQSTISIYFMMQPKTSVMSLIQQHPGLPVCFNMSNILAWKTGSTAWPRNANGSLALRLACFLDQLKGQNPAVQGVFMHLLL